MAQATAVVREATVTLELSELEAAIVIGIVGTANTNKLVGADVQVELAVASIRNALRASGLENRMTDYGVRVGTPAVVVGI